MSIQKLVDKFLIEFVGIDFRHVAFPPIGFGRTIMKPNAAELARVSENESAFFLKKNKMIVFGWPMMRSRDVDLAGHAEMNAEPAPNVFASPDNFGVAVGKLEEHAFSTPLRAQEFFADQSFTKVARICSSKDAVLRVQAKIDNLIAPAGVPLFAIPFDLSQFGHRRN